MTNHLTNANGRDNGGEPDSQIDTRVVGDPGQQGSHGNSCNSTSQLKEEQIMKTTEDFNGPEPSDVTTQNTELRYNQEKLNSVCVPGEWTPFPVDRLPKPLQSLVTEGSVALGCDPVYIALACLVVAASAIGNTRRLKIKRTWSPCHVLWGVIVGESGSMKTPAFELVTAPVGRRQRESIKSFDAAMETCDAKIVQFKADIAKWKAEGCAGERPKCPEKAVMQRCIVKNATVEKMVNILQENWRGVLLALDELSGWFGSFNRYQGKGNVGADESFWLSSFNCQDAIVDRKTGIPPTLFVPDAAVCVLGGIQPGTLRRAMSVENRESGMAARLLMVYPPPQLEAPAADSDKGDR